MRTMARLDSGFRRSDGVAPTGSVQDAIALDLLASLPGTCKLATRFGPRLASTTYLQTPDDLYGYLQKLWEVHLGIGLGESV